MIRLVLIDAHAIIHRAYHALPVLTNRSGQQTNAVYGFVSMLLKIINELKPTHIIACFDSPGPTFRQEIYIAYQAKRPETDEELVGQFDIVKGVVKAAGIPIYALQGFEADDIIGTIKKQASKLTRYQIVIVTGDRDILQLIDKKTKVYMPIKGLSEAKLFGKKEVEGYLGVKPRQIVDYKALVGDQSDNYPGVYGIGPKTAVGLLKSFGTFENIYKKMENARLPKPGTGVQTGWKTPAVAAKLKGGKDAGLLSKKLAKIATNVPVKLDVNKAKLKDLKTNERFIAKLGQLGFRSLVKRVVGEKEKRNNDKQSLFQRNKQSLFRWNKKNSGQARLV